MLPSRTANINSNNNNNNNNNNNSHHRRQWSEGIVSTENPGRLYRNDDRQLIQHLLNEYLLHGSNDVLHLIRTCPNECFEALVDFIWNKTSQTIDSNEVDLHIYNQRSSLLSSSLSNTHRQGARQRLALVFIEIFKLLATPTANGGRSDIQRQNRFLLFPGHVHQLIQFEPDIHGLSCLALASILLTSPLIVHQKITLLTDALKHAANQFVNAHFFFDTPSTFAVSIYSLFYLLYILYPNTLRRELQPEAMQSMNSLEKPINRLGIKRVLLPLCYHFKLQTSIVCGTAESEKNENRWQNENWQHLIANGDRYVISDDLSPLLSTDFKRRREEEMKTKSTDPDRFNIEQIIRMCNEYTESVLHPSEMKSQIVKTSIEKQYGNKHSTDCSSNYSDSHCQTYEQQWQSTIQNGQINLARIQTPDETNRRHLHANGASSKKDSTSIDHNVQAKVHLQLDMLDCNYEQDKREHYAQLIRNFKKTTTPIHELDKELRDQELHYDDLINARQQKCPVMHDIRGRIKEFHQMNEAFYNSLSDTQIESKTDEDEHWQQRSAFIDKHTKCKTELEELGQAKVSIENELREMQRRSFQSKQEAKQSLELRDLIQKLKVELICARKKHQLLHNALVNVKSKPTNVMKLFAMHENLDEDEKGEEDQQHGIITLDEKRGKFEEYKRLLDKQKNELTTKRNSFNQTRNMNTHKINIVRRQIDSIRICQSQMNNKSQILQREQ